jgi:antitoxin component YwqK of YwqJK toxin-antitoxin module
MHLEDVERSVGRRSPTTRAEEGFWTYWYPNGALREQGRYIGGRRVGEWEQFHANGVRWARGCRAWNPATGACERVGLWTFWYSNGQREARGVFVAGRREGHWEYAHRDGSLDGDRSGEYHDDVRFP